MVGRRRPDSVPLKPPSRREGFSKGRHSIMDLTTAMRERHSCREFLPTVPSRESVLRAVASASTAPSSKNGQPWKLHVALGESVDRIRTALCGAFDAGLPVAPDYRYSPAEMPPEMLDRARACGISLFVHKGIGRDDKDKRRLHDRENFRLFGAPALAVLTLPRVAEKGTFMDGGLFLGQFLLALRGEGYEATPMYSVVGYPDILRRELGIADDRLVACAVPFGIEDASAHVNAYRTVRELPETIVSWA